MDGKRENAGVVSKNRRRAIAVMDIGVHGHRCANLPCRLEGPDGDGDIVDHAEALSVARIGVMESSAKISGKSVLKSLAPGKR